MCICLSGPFFHWWYGTLERTVSGLRLTSPYITTLVKVAITQLVMTPPFLVFTLGFIKYFMSMDVNETVVAVKRTFAAALFTNWKVRPPCFCCQVMSSWPLDWDRCGRWRRR